MMQHKYHELLSLGRVHLVAVVTEAMGDALDETLDLKDDEGICC